MFSTENITLLSALSSLGLIQFGKYASAILLLFMYNSGFPNNIATFWQK